MPDTDRFNFQTGSWSRDDGPTDAATLVIAGDWTPIRVFAPLIESDPKPTGSRISFSGPT